MWAVFVMTQQVDVTAVHHLSHDENANADVLSRNGFWAEVYRQDKRRKGSLPRHLPYLDLQCRELLMLCDPSVSIDTDDDFCDFFREALQFNPSNPSGRRDLY